MNNDLIKERQRKLIEAVRGAPIAQEMGMALSYTENGEAVWDMPYNPKFDHALHGIHGGVFATLLDNAGWFTAAPHYDTWIATIELQIHLLEHVQNKHLQAIGHLVRTGKSIATETRNFQ